MLTKLIRGMVAMAVLFFSIVYVCLLIPALVYMPIVGALAFTNEKMTILGGITCILAMLTIPISMGASVYFMCAYSSRRKYLKTLFFCFLPIILLFLCLAFMNLVVYFHGI